MFTNVHLHCQLYLDVCHWHATATWRDDPQTEPVVLEMSGDVRVSPYAAPTEVLCKAAWESAAAACRRAQRDGAEFYSVPPTTEVGPVVPRLRHPDVGGDPGLAVPHD